MNDKVVPGPLCGPHSFKEAVCISTSKIYDTCKDKDCARDLRVYFTSSCQEIVDRSVNLRVKKAEIVWVYIDVDEVPFNNGFYTVDIKFYFKVTFDAYCGLTRPVEIEGIASYDKRVILYGSEGASKTYTSTYRSDETTDAPIVTTNLPKAAVDVVPPIALGVTILDKCDCCCGNSHIDVQCIPERICNYFGGCFVDNCGTKAVLVTLGLFTIVRLERDVQLLIPAYDFCIPQKECNGPCDDDPCALFSTIDFPTDEFFPPSPCNLNTRGNNHGNCGCGK